MGLPCDATGRFGGPAAHVQSGIDPAVDDCFVWPPKLCHTGKAIPGSLVRDAGSVVRRADDVDEQWRIFVQSLAVQLRRRRVESGLSQEDVAYRAGLSRYIYHQYEKGESRRGSPANPGLRSIMAIAQVLDVSVDELLPRPLPDLRGR
ncbi:helix-turn-helix transcriptional regulator [Microbacterium sp. NPDC079176]|uniref:helix-turn-helix domain-containing protein n=1 Tax=Microbacterium sp. NPDC079176 TaxID=3154768 RepID=UPI0034161785